jgi:hypothetical protein
VCGAAVRGIIDIIALRKQILEILLRELRGKLEESFANYLDTLQ